MDNNYILQHYVYFQNSFYKIFHLKHNFYLHNEFFYCCSSVEIIYNMYNIRNTNSCYFVTLMNINSDINKNSFKQLAYQFCIIHQCIFHLMKHKKLGKCKNKLVDRTCQQHQDYTKCNSLSRWKMLLDQQIVCQKYKHRRKYTLPFLMIVLCLLFGLLRILYDCDSIVYLIKK